MPAKKQISHAQEQVLLQLMQENLDMATGRNSSLTKPLAKQAALQFWQSVASRLNAMGSGTSKPALKWRDYWSERKYAVKKKAAQLQARASGTGGRPTKSTKLTDVEKLILSIMGNFAVNGTSASEEVPDAPQPPLSPPPPLPIVSPLPFPPPAPPTPVIAPPTPAAAATSQQQSEVRPEGLQTDPQSLSSNSASISHQQMRNVGGRDGVSKAGVRDEKPRDTKPTIGSAREIGLRSRKTY